MGRSARIVITASLLGLVVAGCGQKRTHGHARTAVPTTTAPSAPVVDDPAPDREKRPRFGEAAVYVDGKPAGVLRHAELPAKLKGLTIDLGGGYQATRYPFTDYARAIGVDPKRVKALHLYGGKRVVVVDHAELTRLGAGLVFSFTSGDRGKPRMHFPPVKLNVNTTIDMLSGAAFYVDKEPPHLEDGELVMPDGTKVGEKVPYAPEEQGNGTRVYVDGSLIGTVKRKKLTNDLLAPSDPEDTSNFSLLAYATKLRPEAKQAKTVDLVAGDDVVARLPQESVRGVTFQVPARNRGQANVEVPTVDGKKTARVSAIQIFVNASPPERALTKIDDAPEATPGAGGGGGGGGGGGSGDDD